MSMNVDTDECAWIAIPKQYSMSVALVAMLKP